MAPMDEDGADPRLATSPRIVGSYRPIESHVLEQRSSIMPSLLTRRGGVSQAFILLAKGKTRDLSRHCGKRRLTADCDLFLSTCTDEEYF
jgi:hypothetical protein